MMKLSVGLNLKKGPPEKVFRSLKAWMAVAELHLHLTPEKSPWEGSSYSLFLALNAMLQNLFSNSEFLILASENTAAQNHAEHFGRFLKLWAFREQTCQAGVYKLGLPSCWS